MKLPKKGHSAPHLKDVLSRLARRARGGLLGVSETAEALQITPPAARVRLSRLVRGGWLMRVQRGLYHLKPLESVPSAPSAPEDSWVLACRLFSPCYIGGWSAAEHWGWTEQIFNTTFVVTAAAVRSSHPKLLGTEFHLVRVSASRIEGTTPVWRGAERVPVSDRERTIADACCDPAWVGGIRHLSQILAACHEGRDWNPARLAEHLERIGRGAAGKRLGYLVERFWPAEKELIERMHRLRSAGINKLDPALASKGKYNGRWGLWVNASLDEVSA